MDPIDSYDAAMYELPDTAVADLLEQGYGVNQADSCGQLPVTEMLRFQKRYGINESLLNPYNRHELHQKVTDQDVELIGGYPGDPDFERSFRHNGEVVTSAEIVP